MRAVHFDGAPVSDDFVHFMKRACNVAVVTRVPQRRPFGQLMEGTRDTLATQIA